MEIREKLSQINAKEKIGAAVVVTVIVAAVGAIGWASTSAGTAGEAETGSGEKKVEKEAATGGGETAEKTTATAPRKGKGDMSANRTAKEAGEPNENERDDD